MASPASAAAAAVAAEPPPDRRSLGEAVAALYTSPDPIVRAAADAWLQNFLRSEHAWPLSISLLRDNPADLTSLEALFCARALHVLLRRCVAKAEKTQKSHAVLGDADWTEMRDALLPMAWRFAILNTIGAGVGGAGDAPPRTVLTQVALAIAALACKMPNWDAGTIVADLAGYFLADPGGAPASAVDVVLRHGGGSNGADGTAQLFPEGSQAGAHNRLRVGLN
jgi:transportin-3